MTQKSLPWGYLTGDDSLVGYTAKEDSAIRAAIARSGAMIVDSSLRTLPALANRGVFYSVGNKLEVTNPGGAANRIAVDSGAAFVCGIFHYNTDSIWGAGDITSPVANPRIDRVVVRANFSAAAYVPARASAALFTVPPNTARVTVIHGAEAAGPVAPALIQDVARLTYWDTPLYQYQISVGGAITALTDEREWVDAEIKSLYVPCGQAVDVSAGNTQIVRTSNYGWFFDEGTVFSRAWADFVVPADYVTGIITVKAIVRTTGAGNIWVQNTAYYGACGELMTTHSDVFIFAVATVGTAYADNCCVAKVDLNLVNARDIVTLIFERDASQIGDTLAGEVYFLGWFVEYLGWH